jgi:hypothetical protein
MRSIVPLLTATIGQYMDRYRTIPLSPDIQDDEPKTRFVDFGKLADSIFVRSHIFPPNPNKRKFDTLNS